MRPFLKTKDYSITGDEFELLHNEELDMLITQPQPENLDGYYKSNTYISHSDSKRTLVEKLYQLIKTYSLWRKVRLMNSFTEQRTILDVGAGTGDFLREARRRKWAIDGVEPNRMARGLASEKGIMLYETLKEVPETTYAVITLWHVLEHLPQLEEQMKRLISYLKEDGTLFVAVPNFKSYDANYYQNFWAAYDVPRHLWHFSRSSIELLFAKHGMRVVKTKPMIFDAFYVALLSEKYKTGKSNFFKAFYIGLRSNLNAWKNKEYSSILYILKKA